MGSRLPARCESQRWFHFKSLPGSRDLLEDALPRKDFLNVCITSAKISQTARLKPVKLKGKEMDGKKREISDRMCGCYSGRESGLTCPLPGTQWPFAVTGCGIKRAKLQAGYTSVFSVCWAARAQCCV